MVGQNKNPILILALTYADAERDMRDKLEKKFFTKIIRSAMQGTDEHGQKYFYHWLGSDNNQLLSTEPGGLQYTNLMYERNKDVIEIVTMGIRRVLRTDPQFCGPATHKIT